MKNGPSAEELDQTLDRGCEIKMYPIDRIKVGRRFRQDLGDIAGLAKSIAAQGLLQPLVIDGEGNLIIGQRRLIAVKELGHAEVLVRIVNLENPLLAEQDENTLRKQFTPSEAAEIGRAIEDKLKGKAKERQKASRAVHGQKIGTNGRIQGASNLDAPMDRGRVDEQAAKAVGLSKDTYRKAKLVVEAAEQDPETFNEIKEEMDKTGKVDPAFKKVKAKGGGHQPGSVRRKQGEEIKEILKSSEAAKPIKDELGVTVPNHLKDTFHSRKEFQLALSHLNNAKSKLHLLDGARVAGRGGPRYLDDYLEELMVAFQEDMPFAVCPDCGGDQSTPCNSEAGCMGIGWLSVFAFEKKTEKPKEVTLENRLGPICQDLFDLIDSVADIEDLRSIRLRLASIVTNLETDIKRLKG
jgi:ParB-like chromosome segregation protein Spo0J